MFYSLLLYLIPFPHQHSSAMIFIILYYTCLFILSVVPIKAEFISPSQLVFPETNSEPGFQFVLNTYLFAVGLRLNDDWIFILKKLRI